MATTQTVESLARDALLWLELMERTASPFAATIQGVVQAHVRAKALATKAVADFLEATESKK